MFSTRLKFAFENTGHSMIMKVISSVRCYPSWWICYRKSKTLYHLPTPPTYGIGRRMVFDVQYVRPFWLTGSKVMSISVKVDEWTCCGLIVEKMSDAAFGPSHFDQSSLNMEQLLTPTKPWTMAWYELKCIWKLQTNNCIGLFWKRLYLPFRQPESTCTTFIC